MSPSQRAEMGHSTVNGKALMGRVMAATAKGSPPALTLQAARVEFQVEFGLGLGLQGSVASEELDLPLAVDSPGAWNR